MRDEIVVYTRRGCHLCDEAIAVVRRVAAGRARIRLVDIDADPALFERYTMRVPVVTVNEREIAEYHVTSEQVEVALGHGGFE